MHTSHRQRPPAAPYPTFGDQGYAQVSDLTRRPQLLPKLYLNLTGNAR